MSSSELEDTRGQGKGDSRNDGDDPAEDFEDAADSEAADDAQQTLNEIEAEVEESREGDTASASTGDVAADTTSGDSDTTGSDSSSPEPGRNGLASNQEVLDNAFDHAETRTDARDYGISEGNTTADSMEVLELEDGSRVFATDADDAYPTMLAESPEEAIENNIRSPKVIEALGGDACKSALTEDAEGNRYIVREGIEGDLVGDTVMGDVDDATARSAEDTMAAAYFVGNRDLHAANMMVDSDGNVTIIDHDSAGMGPSGTTVDMEGYAKYNTVRADTQAVRHKIYDTAHQIKSGEQSLPVSEGTSHHEYAHKTAEKAVRRSYVDSSYDAPDGNKPAALQSPPDGCSATTDFSSGDSVRFVNHKGEIVGGTVKSASDRSVAIDGTVTNDSIRLTDDELTRVVEVE